MLNTVADLELNVGRVGDPRFWLELTVMKLMKAASTVDLQTVIDQLGGGAAPTGGRPSLPRSAERSSPASAPPIKSVRATASAGRATKPSAPAAGSPEEPESSDD